MERYQLPQQEQTSLERLRQPFAIYQFVDKRVVTLVLSDGFCQLFGYTDRAQAYDDMDNDMYKDTHPDDVARIANAAYRFATEGGRYEVIYRSRKPGSFDYRIVHAWGEHVYTDTGVQLAHVWYSDEGDYMESCGQQGVELNQSLSNALHENSIVKASQYDFLTGLPSMTYFFELVETGKEKIRDKGGNPVLMYMDFIGMKFYNAKYGFAEGDKLLQGFAAILAKLFGNENSCRIGADHFAVQTEEAGLEPRLQLLLAQCRELNGGNTIPVHIGIYTAQEERVHTSVACDRAKMACGTLKGSYYSDYSYYSAQLREDALLRQYIIESFDRALEEKRIRVYLQPIIRAVNGQVCDVEALARWIDPEKGLLSPADFIPALEEAGLIHRLDLYMLDEVLALIRAQEAEGFAIIPHSINLSRIDFEVCDMVEEIRRRVDEAGVSRDRITVEITESVIGSDFAFMKTQVERFRELGFPVWMDDFGSGYSSLDMLQSIKFDLIKFDMSFMRKPDEGDNGNVILPELMRMATSLGVDTVCEGVETEEQVHFLQEIGCSKLQGYYFSKPIPFETILENFRDKSLIANEDPAQAEYFETIGRVNLYDLGQLSGTEENVLRHSFSTIPIAILEVGGEFARHVRSNDSYRYLAKRFFGLDDLYEQFDLRTPKIAQLAGFISAVRQCRESAAPVLFREKARDGYVFHFYLRRLCVNPVTGSTAVAVAALSITEPDESTSYADIARALAADYYNLFVIDLDTNAYIEYSSRVGAEELSVVRRGEDFFASARRDTMTRIYEEDRETFLSLFSKDRVLRDLDQQGVFTTTYRLIDTGKPMYVNMKVTRLPGGNRIILGISIIDAHMKQLEEEKKLRQERNALSRIAALSPDYIVLYTVDPETGRYTQYSPSTDFAAFGLANQGEDFFADVVTDAPKAIVPEDIERHLRTLTKENLLREIRENGFFSHHYRMVMAGQVVPSSLKATMVEEADGKRILIGVTRDEDEKFSRQLEAAYRQAKNSAVIYTHLAHALARGYTDLFYVNMDTDEFIEFHTDDSRGVLSEARRSADFFEGCERDAKLFVHPEDQIKFVRAMNRRFLSRALERSKVFEMTYRRIKDGRTFYVQMKVSRMEDDPRIIVIAVADIDEQMRQRREETRIQEERLVYARLHAITGNFICVYVVDPETGRYREFSASVDYEKSFAQAKDGGDFFAALREAAGVYTHPDDRDRVLSLLTRENVMAEIEQNGIFSLGYRIMKEDRPLHIQLKAAMVEEKEGTRLIVGLNDIDAQVRQEESFRKRLAQAQSLANIDALTGVKNKHAYLEVEAQLDRRIAEQRQEPFAVVMLDINGLKKVNDTAGHQAGDQYLRDACKIICDVFKHSPVFRVGGDEFAVIVRGHDFTHLDALLEEVNRHNAEALRTGGIVIACGMAKYDKDVCVAPVFDRADQKMYENKNRLKSGRAEAQEK